MYKHVNIYSSNPTYCNTAHSTLYSITVLCAVLQYFVQYYSITVLCAACASLSLDLRIRKKLETLNLI